MCTYIIRTRTATFLLLRARLSKKSSKGFFNFFRLQVFVRSEIFLACELNRRFVGRSVGRSSKGRCQSCQERKNDVSRMRNLPSSVRPPIIIVIITAKFCSSSFLLPKITSYAKLKKKIFRNRRNGRERERREKFLPIHLPPTVRVRTYSAGLEGFASVRSGYST